MYDNNTKIIYKMRAILDDTWIEYIVSELIDII